MEAEKRKQAGNDVVSGRHKHKKARDETTVNEDEVQEFFAIIKRIHVAINYFKSANGGGSKYVDGELRAMIESNEEADGVKGMAKTTKEEDVGFDLNAEPDPEFDLS
ncbi:hypothetical protein RchiOBHm_Chr4g0435331 [Rosa chinensis]|uniref:Uncharacterized protein n=1 Tax=Rosa chinensis TaxID=74649 RepID=A0A2P6R1S9_ROSCH|nr:protein NIM1-INTERACTING 2 [Rosa chinensis]PRQ40376.1 hypothetical protein RchiOBHm_Chr4g0435331 [Rosa chinensis]